MKFLKKHSIFLFAIFAACCGFAQNIACLDSTLENPDEGRAVSDFKMSPFYGALLDGAIKNDNPRYLAEFINKANQSGWKFGEKMSDAKCYAVAGNWAKFSVLAKDKRLLNFAQKDLLKIAETKDAKDSEKSAWKSAEQIYGGAFAYSNMYAATKNKRLLEYLDYRLKEGLGANSKSSKICDEAFVLNALLETLKNTPEDWSSREFYKDEFLKIANRAKNANPSSLSNSVKLKGAERAAISALIANAFFGAINADILKEKDFAATAEKFLDFAKAQKKLLKSDDVFLSGVLANAEFEMSKIGHPDSEGGDFEKLLAGARAILLDKSSTASFAKIEPRRADDIAWENDKTAYRAYGPALEKTIENGGFDIWGKTVSYPVIQKWYDEDLSKVRSYHEDHGEGMDSYKVADSSGVGSTVMYDGGKILRSNVYKSGQVFWTKPDCAKLGLLHHFKFADSKVVSDFKTLVIKSGDNFFEVNGKLLRGLALETVDASECKSLVPENKLQVGIGILCQSNKAQIFIAPDNSYMYVVDKMAGKKLVQFVAISKGVKIEGSKIENFDSKLKEAFIIVSPNSKGEYSYKTGYFFEGRSSEMPSDFDAYLKDIAK